MIDHKKICEEMLERFIAWAESNQNIRLALIWGSRARKSNPADEWSDLDLVIVAREPDTLLMSDQWITTKKKVRARPLTRYRRFLG